MEEIQTALPYLTSHYFFECCNLHATLTYEGVCKGVGSTIYFANMEIQLESVSLVKYNKINGDGPDGEGEMGKKWKGVKDWNRKKKNEELD